MTLLTITSEYQVAIPESIREKLNLIPGSKLQALLYQNRIELIPITTVEKMRGFLPGIDTKVEREPSERGPADET